MPNQLETTLERINQLQIVFIAKLGEKVKELSRLILQIDSSISVQTSCNQHLLTKIYALAHNLVGSSGTFNQTVIYNKAKAIEILSEQLLTATSPKEIPIHWHKLLLELIVSLRGDAKLSGRPAIVENFSTLFPENTCCATIEGQCEKLPIIIVDDDELLTSLIKEQVKHFEYNVIALTSTADLEQAIAQYQPAAILIDVVFPDAKHSGIEIINQLKANHKIHCPVIFMSTRCDMAVRLDALRAGSNAYIVKPLEILELIRILDRLTQKLHKNKSRILIVDDDPLITDFYKTAFTDNGFICDVLLNPLEIINKIASFTPDAILLDINMPNCDGFEIAQVIRQDDNFTHIPLLFLTSASTSEQEIQAMSSGGDDFLDKSTDLPTLLAIVKGHVQRYKELDSVLTRLKRDEVRFRSVTSSTHDGIISVDQKGRIVFWNEGAETIFGYRSLEIIGQPLDLIIPFNEKKQPHGFTKLYEGQFDLVQKSIETIAVKKDKTLINIELSYTEWATGNEIFYTTILRDVTQRKQIEQKLQNNEASLKAIFTSSGEGIITINSQGIIETANPKTAELFGYPVEELIGKNVSILVPEPEKHRHNDYVLESELHSPRIIGHARELTGERKDGSLFYLELNVSPMMIDGERKFVGILHDISERKQFIREILLAKSGAETANIAKSQFLSNMSHELRTPLNAILGFTQILQTDTEYPPNADQLDSLNHIYSSGLHLLALITQVLDLSKIEEGIFQMNNEKFDLVAFTEEVIVPLKPLAMNAAVYFIDIKTQSPLWVITDKVKLKQVLNNLLSNAIKYNKPQGYIEVSFMRLSNKIRLSVTDTGRGIAEHLMADLFKPFCRLGAETSSIEGTGIGLTITKKLITLMGGEIGVVSKEHEGSTFWIELAIADG